MNRPAGASAEAGSPRRLRVLITVDTEMWPARDRDPGSAIAEAARRDIFGETRRGTWGLAHVMESLEAHGLRGVFFVEALCAAAAEAAREPLSRAVRAIVARGHDVQLHVHPEWLRRTGGEALDLAVPDPVRMTRTGEVLGQHLHHFSREGQRALIEEGARQIERAGAPPPTAFRAGSFGADRDTIVATAEAGIPYDSSLNPAWSDGPCALGCELNWRVPAPIGAVLEVPVTTFRDGRGMLRHLQVNGCSATEMRAVLERAHAADWPSVVIVMHSFELLNRRRDGPDPIVLGRWRALLKHLADGADRFRVCTFRDLELEAGDLGGGGREIRTSRASWLRRMSGQVARRVVG